jgi:hypothetical protein
MSLADVFPTRCTHRLALARSVDTSHAARCVSGDAVAAVGTAESHI